MTNLLRETRRELEKLEKTPENIIFIGSYDGEYRCTWEEFEKLADLDYDDSYGSAEIARDIVVLFDDNSWLSRGEYDGSEWWEYNTPPGGFGAGKPISRLGRGMWDSVAELNRGEED